MTSTNSTDPQSRLCTAVGAVNCSNRVSVDSSPCAFGQLPLNNLSALNDPFFAQLPAGYNTGLIRQFLPRISSAVVRDRIDESDFPSNCSDSYTPSFFANYSGTAPRMDTNLTEVRTPWYLIACMLEDTRMRPTSQLRLRLDFSEQLYLNLSAQPDLARDDAPDEWSGLFRITMNTTSGYFELPNYMNAGLPGPLLSEAPKDQCGQDCILQGTWADADAGL